MAAKKKPAPKKKVAAKKPTKKAPAKKPATAKKKVAPKKVVAKRPAGKKAPARRTSRRPAPRPAARRPKVVKGPKAPLHEAPEALALARAVAAVAVDKKAEDVVLIDARARSSSVGYDYVVLASGESDRQLAAIHEGVEQLLKPQGTRAASVEASPDWVCVNYDQGVVAHFFTPEKRELMDLEGLWKDAPRVALR